MPEKHQPATDQAPDGWTHENWVAYTQLYVDAAVGCTVALSAYVVGFATTLNGLDIVETQSATGAGFALAQFSPAEVLGGATLGVLGLIALVPALDRFIEARVATDLRNDPLYDFRGEFFDD